jgi:hypothetical protein
VTLTPPKLGRNPKNKYKALLPTKYFVISPSTSHKQGITIESLLGIERVNLETMEEEKEQEVPTSVQEGPVPGEENEEVRNRLEEGCLTSLGWTSC